jgi:hypothetical protein
MSENQFQFWFHPKMEKNRTELDLQTLGMDLMKHFIDVMVLASSIPPALGNDSVVPKNFDIVILTTEFKQGSDQEFKSDGLSPSNVASI